MENKHQLSEVFGTNRNIPKTYTERPEVDDRFINDLTRNKHIVIHGSSRQGKTCLRKHHLKDDDYVVIQCTEELEKHNLYELILKESGVACEVHSTVRDNSSNQIEASVSGEFNLGIISKIASTVKGVKTDKVETEKQETSFKINLRSATDILAILQASGFNKYIVFEDFHYLSDSVQSAIAQDLKAFYDNSSLVFIIVGVWLESNRLIMYNGDLTGRIITLPADSWSKEKLAEILFAGESLLNVRFSENVKNEAIELSYGNVGVMQEIAHRLCESYHIWHTQEETATIDDVKQVRIALRGLAKEQEARYRNFLTEFSKGFGVSKYEYYKWILIALIGIPAKELQKGIDCNRLFQLIKEQHPLPNKISLSALNSSLGKIHTLQQKKKIRPAILDYSARTLRISDAVFCIFKDMHYESELSEYFEENYA